MRSPTRENVRMDVPKAFWRRTLWALKHEPVEGWLYVYAEWSESRRAYFLREVELAEARKIWKSKRRSVTIPKLYRVRGGQIGKMRRVGWFDGSIGIREDELYDMTAGTVEWVERTPDRELPVVDVAARREAHRKNGWRCGRKADVTQTQT